MSIGSVGSIQSPMHHNLSVHSQPSSVPVNEQNILSPIPPSVVSPPSMTPSLDHNVDQKPDIQNINNLDKTVDNSQPSTSHADGTDSTLKADYKMNNQQKQSESQSKENFCLKRPALVALDCENSTDDDCSMNQVLYDYSTWDAWYVIINSISFRLTNALKLFQDESSNQEIQGRRLRKKQSFTVHEIRLVCWPELQRIFRSSKLCQPRR